MKGNYETNNILRYRFADIQKYKPTEIRQIALKQQAGARFNCSMLHGEDKHVKMSPELSSVGNEELMTNLDPVRLQIILKNLTGTQKNY